MVLRKVIFPRALGASGVQGFFGDPFYPEYKHSPIIKAICGDIFKDMGFVAKTVTISYNRGNVPLAMNMFSFKELLPKAIHPFIAEGAALNAVGLSNYGFENLLNMGIWQFKKEPFMLSFMAIGKTKEDRLKEARDFVSILKKKIPYFMSPFGLQVNFSCPNTGHDQKDLINEAKEILSILDELDIPLIPKINAVLPAQIAHEILEFKECDALCFSNTIPFGEFPKLINWRKYSKNGKSPLEKYGFPKGGLSGAPIFPVVVDWLEQFEKINSNTKPVIAGGGVMHIKDVQMLSKFKSVSAISIGTVAFTRPWRVPGIIKECNNCLCED